MDSKPIKLTMHAVERGLTHNLDQKDIRIVTEGNKKPEGKYYTLKTRKETLIAVCDEDGQLPTTKVVGLSLQISWSRHGFDATDDNKLVDTVGSQPNRAV